MMSCGRARRLLWPDTGPREVTDEIMAARGHAGGCPDCRRFLEDMRRLGEGIREAVPPTPAPMEVRDRLFRSIARARTGDAGRTRGQSRRRLGAVVAAALLLGGAWLGWRTASGPSLRPDALSAIDRADIVVLLVDHRQFGLIDPEALKDKKLIDTRGLWTWRKARRTDARIEGRNSLTRPRRRSTDKAA